jgi:hypothetical protein
LSFGCGFWLIDTSFSHLILLQLSSDSLFQMLLCLTYCELKANESRIK